ncbi:MAG: tripartite tricarboxylate transporter substrate-binding protein [Burkholderiales bacterium]
MRKRTPMQLAAIVLHGVLIVLPALSLAIWTAPRACDDWQQTISPQLATVSESGVQGYDATTWCGVLAPAGTPRGVVTRLNAAIAAAPSIPDVWERLTAQGVEPTPNTPDECALYKNGNLQVREDRPNRRYEAGVCAARALFRCTTLCRELPGVALPMLDSSVMLAATKRRA